jgi:twinkle protein
MKTFADYGIHLGGKTGIEVQTTCPQCSASRRKKNAKCLSVNTEKGVWICHHCDWRGSLAGGEEARSRRPYVRPEWPTPKEGPWEQIARERGIPRHIFEAEGIRCVSAYMPQQEGYTDCLVFPYVKRGELVNLKYRALASKAFRQVAGAEKILYRQDCISKDQVVITEGEFDALSIVAAGISSVVSVPDGAPPPTATQYASKFTYLDQDPDPFEGVADIVLAVDADEPGQALARELARRLGIDRCRLVRWPADCKDANDALRLYGPEHLRELIAQAQPFPVQDVVTILDTVDAVMHEYQYGRACGFSTGWESVDRYYTVEPGHLTIVTGIPGHGKSEFLDALAINLCQLHGWRFAVCSPENAPIQWHVAKLLEKVVGKPFRVGPSERMSPQDVMHGLEWLQAHMTFIVPSDVLTLSAVLDRATVLVRRQGIRGLIIDPYNEFDHQRPSGQTETEYIGAMLTTIRQWARKWQVAIWLVAHPQKLFRRDDGTYPVPTPWDISGSAHWRNKADNCLTVWRDETAPDSPIQVHVQKVRYKHIGHVGMAELAWDRMTGRYRSIQPCEVPGGSHEDARMFF